MSLFHIACKEGKLDDIKKYINDGKEDNETVHVNQGNLEKNILMVIAHRSI